MEKTYSRNDKIISRKFYEYLIPTVLMVIAMQFGSLADAIVVGNFLGDEALSASSLALPAIFLVQIPPMMIGNGAGIVGARYIGKRQVGEASKVFRIALLSSFLLSAIFIPFGLFGSNSVASWFAGNFQELAPMISQYIQVYAYQAPLLGIGITVAYFLPSDNNPNLGALFFIICNIVHIGTEILFCLFLDRSVAMYGAAASMGLGMLVGLVVLIPYAKSKRRTISFKATQKQSLPLLWEIVRAGSSAGALTGLSCIYYLVLNLAATAYLTPYEMPVFAMLSNFSFVIDLFVIGILQIMPSVISSLFGEKDYYSIRSVAKKVMGLALIVTVILTVISLVWPQLFFSIFGVDLGVVESAVPPGGISPLLVVRIYCISFLLYTANKYFVYYYPSIMANAPAVVSNLIRFGAVGPIAIYFLMQGLGSIGFAYGVIIAEGATLILTLGYVILWRKVKHLSVSPLLLLPKEGAVGALELTIPAEEKEISKAVETLQKAAENLCNDELSAAKLAVAIEEIIANAIAYGLKKKTSVKYLDVRLSRTENSIIARIRDDGVSFDPTSYNNEEEEMRYHGIEVIRSIASSFQYFRVLNTNNTVIEIAMKKAA